MSLESISRKKLEQSGEVLKEHGGSYRKTTVSTSQNQWETAMKGVPTFEQMAAKRAQFNQQVSSGNTKNVVNIKGNAQSIANHQKNGIRR